MADEKTQLGKFKEAAREHHSDEDEAHWDERLRSIVKGKTQPDKAKPPN